MKISKQNFETALSLAICSIEKVEELGRINNSYLKEEFNALLEASQKGEEIRIVDGKYDDASEI